jgi:hypothetical protein
MSNYWSFVDDLKAKVKGTDKNETQPLTTRMAVPHHGQPYKTPGEQTYMMVPHHGQPYKTPGELQTYMVVPHHGQPYNTQLKDINGNPI